MYFYNSHLNRLLTIKLVGFTPHTPNERILRILETNKVSSKHPFNIMLINGPLMEMPIFHPSHPSIFLSFLLLEACIFAFYLILTFFTFWLFFSSFFFSTSN